MSDHQQPGDSAAYLLDQAREGGTDGIAQLYAFITRSVLKSAGRSLSRDEIEDVVQDTLVLALGRIHDNKITPENFKSWLRAVSRNVQTSYIRRHKRLSPTSLVELPDDVFDTASLIQLTDDALIVNSLLHELPEFERKVILLRFEGASFQKISDLLGVTESEVRLSLGKSLQKLKDGYIQEVRDV